MLEVAIVSTKCALRDEFPEFREFYESKPWIPAPQVEEMENVTKLSVPLTVECNYGNNWLEAH